MADPALEADNCTLVGAVQDGDTDAIAVPFRRHYRTVGGCAHTGCRRPEAEEVALVP